MIVAAKKTVVVKAVVEVIAELVEKAEAVMFVALKIEFVITAVVVEIGMVEIEKIESVKVVVVVVTTVANVSVANFVEVTDLVKSDE